MNQQYVKTEFSYGADFCIWVEFILSLQIVYQFGSWVLHQKVLWPIITWFLT